MEQLLLFGAKEKKAESYENVVVGGLPYRDQPFRVIGRFSRGSFWRGIPSKRSEWPYGKFRRRRAPWVYRPRIPRIVWISSRQPSLFSPSVSSFLPRF